MATWLVHLQIAERLLEKFPFIAEEFYIGNIAPDCGLPQGNGTYSPSSEITHWTTDADHKSTCDYTRFKTEYIDNEHDFSLLSYKWGYYCHLLTDVIWSTMIVAPTKEKYRKLYDRDKNEFYRLVKRDWRNNDFIFLQKNSDYTPLRMLSEKQIQHKAESVGNCLPYYTSDNLTDKLLFLPKFYNSLNRKLDCDYPYLNYPQYTDFVDKAAALVADNLIKCEIVFPK